MKRANELEALGCLLCAGLAGILQGCGGANAATPNTADNVATTSTDDASSPDPELTAVVSRCVAVEANRALPVSCKLDDSDDGSRMVLTMKDRVVAQQFVDNALTLVAQPFCDLANQRGAAAQVVLALYDEQVMRTANCSDQRFGDWSSSDPEAVEMERAARACSALQASSAPIGCGMSIVDDAPALVVMYNRGDLSQGAWDAIAQGIASPFCNATRARGIQSNVFLIEDAKRALGYNCTTNETMGWIGVARDVVPSGNRNRTAKSQGIATKRVTWRTIAVKE